VGSLCKVPVSNNGFFPLHQQALQLVRYLITRSGPLSIGPLEAVAFFSSESFGKRPDLQFQFTPTNAGEDDRHASMYDMKSFPRSHGYTILPTQVRPLSRGEVRLASAQAGQPPVIDPRYLSHETDRQLLIAGGKKALEVLEADAFAPYRLRNHIPRVTASDDDWLQHISELAECVYHPVGTCKMGRDSTSVVDPQLRVHGIDRLRVADASVMPQISSGNTNAPTMMIAERAADFIVG
jgi:choline dehydrogenase